MIGKWYEGAFQGFKIFSVLTQEVVTQEFVVIIP